jgi:hypothetical protein
MSSRRIIASFFWHQNCFKLLQVLSMIVVMEYGVLSSLVEADVDTGRIDIRGVSMPRLAELQEVIPGQRQAYLQRAAGDGEESLVEDHRSSRSGSNVVEEKLRLLLQNAAARTSFLPSRLPRSSQ